jgi:sugar lactone lactonase YvrE
MFAAAGATDSMKTPESVRYDADLDAYFVSNINGNPSQKDGNGFIVRIDAGNTSAVTMLAQGGKNGVTLNAPKGIAIVGDTLWVADIDAMRAFNKRTGAPIATVDLKPMKATFLNDVVAGPDGSIYTTDSGIFFDAKGAMTHPGHDQIFKITGRKATVAIKSDSALKSPNGIAWDGANSRFVLAPFADKVVSAWKDGDSTVTPLATGPGGYDGIEVLGDGRVLVTSWADSSVHAISNGAFRKVIGNVEAPADIGVDTKRNVVAVPRFNAGRVEYFTISR